MPEEEYSTKIIYSVCYQFTMASLMNDKTIWCKTPSQILNLTSFFIIVCMLFIILFSYKYLHHDEITNYILLGFSSTLIIISIWKWLTVKYLKYEVTEEQLITSYGVLNRHKDLLELYRIRDFRLEKPLLYRMFNLGNLILDTSDLTHPIAVIEAIPDSEILLKTLRHQVELCRKEKNVREVDFT